MACPETDGVTALAARETGTEELISALAIAQQKQLEVKQLTEADRANQKLDDDMRAALIRINTRFLLAFQRSEAFIRAELKRRLH